MAARAWGNEYRTTTVCVDSYVNGIFSGRFYNPYLESGVEFKSLTQFLSEVDHALDCMDFPQSFTTTRTFTSASWQAAEQPDSKHETGALATFAIRILFRQNASWQGSIVWLDQGQEQSFRSALELIFLMDNALRTASTQVN